MRGQICLRKEVSSRLILILRHGALLNPGDSQFDTSNLIHLTQNEMPRYFPLIFKYLHE